jgi:hypothetical protein
MTFTQRLSLLWRRFSPLEERLFATVRNVLPLQATPIFELHEANTAIHITLHEGEFLVLAERAGEEFILHRTEPPSDVMFHLASPDASPEAVRGEIGDILLSPRRNA